MELLAALYYKGLVELVGTFCVIDQKTKSSFHLTKEKFYASHMPSEDMPVNATIT